MIAARSHLQARRLSSSRKRRRRQYTNFGYCQCDYFIREQAGEGNFRLSFPANFSPRGSRAIRLEDLALANSLVTLVKKRKEKVRKNWRDQFLPAERCTQSIRSASSAGEKIDLGRLNQSKLKIMREHNEN